MPELQCIRTLPIAQSVLIIFTGQLDHALALSTEVRGPVFRRAPCLLIVDDISPPKQAARCMAFRAAL